MARVVKFICRVVKIIPILQYFLELLFIIIGQELQNCDLSKLEVQKKFEKVAIDQEILKNRNDFYDPTYEFDCPSHVPSERAVNSKGVR